MFPSVVLLQTCLTAALGAVQIMVGLFNIGLGPGRTSIRPGDLTSLGAAYWLGAVFILTGIMSILSGRFTSSCLMGFTVFMNIAGAIFAFTGIVLYIIDLREASFLWMCERNTAHRHDNNCRKVALIAESLLASMDITLIGLVVLQLLVSLWFAVMGIKVLIGEKKKSNKGIEEQFQEVTC